MRNLSIFVASTPKTVLNNFASGINSILLSISVYATSIRGLSNPFGLLHCKVGKRSLARLGGDRSLSFLLTYLNFHSMPKTNENASVVNNSTHISTDSHETALLLISELNKLASSLSTKISITINVCTIVGNNNIANMGYACGDMVINPKNVKR